LNDVDQIISQLEGQKAAIDRALEALRDISGSTSAAVKQGRPGRPPGSVNAPKKQKRRLSPEGRKRIIEALKKRWAEKRTAEQAGLRKATKKGAKKAAKKTRRRTAAAEESAR
jgi:ABC-type transporter Mla subunit MlaD